MMMNFSEGQKISLLNILNVLVRISDEFYLSKCWNNTTIKLLAAGKLETTDVCNSIVFNCREALSILEDYNFYDLAESNFEFWKDYRKELNEKRFDNLVAVSKAIVLFIENFDIDISGKELLTNAHWLNIMKLSQIASVDLKENLGIISEEEFLY